MFFRLRCCRSVCVEHSVASCYICYRSLSGLPQVRPKTCLFRCCYAQRSSSVQCPCNDAVFRTFNRSLLLTYLLTNCSLSEVVNINVHATRLLRFYANNKKTLQYCTVNNSVGGWPPRYASAPVS